jgi:hypothetical protein
MNDTLRVLTSAGERISAGRWGPFIVRQAKFLGRAGMDVEVFAFHGDRQ